MQPREVEFYVWGAGYAAKEFLYALNEIEEENENVSFVCKGLVDSNEKRWDTEFIGYKVLKPEVVYESSIIPVIIPLENKNEKLIRNNLLMKGYVYKENVWKASDFLAKCLKDSVANAGDEVNIYERVVKKLFTHKTSTENRSYLYAHILVDYLQALLQNGSDVTDVIMCAKQITWEIIEDEVLSIFFLSNNKLFFDSSMDLRRKKQWNDNKQILKKYIADKYLENVSPKADYLKLDNTLYLVVDGQSMYFVDNLMSRDTCLFFCQLDENKNKGLLSFVVQDIKQKAADTIYQKVLMSDASILEYDVKEIYNLVPDSEKYEYLMSREAFYKGDYETAQKYADYGLKKRQFSEKLCLLQGDIFFCQGRYLEAIKYYARTMLKNATREQMWMILSNGELNADENVRESIKKCIECFAGNDKVMIQQCTDILYKELVVYRAKFKEKGIAYQNGKFIIENNEEKKIAYEIREKQKKFFKGEQKKQIFEYFEGDLYLDYELKTAGKTYILPIKRVFDSAIRIEYKNNIISYQGECDETMIVGRTTERFPKNQWVTIRITDDIHIFSEGVFVVGKPIAIGAVEKKPKIVINLFIDALAYARVKDKMDEYMPYTKSFFEKGIIFNECYSVGEWTQTSYPSMFMGLEPRKLECFQPRYQFAMPESEKSLPEQLQGQGYYNTLITADPSERFIVMGPERGFDHSIEKVKQDMAESLQEMIRIIKEYDRPIFMNLHTVQIHDSHFQMGKMATAELNEAGIDFDLILGSDAYCGDQNICINEAYRKRELIYLKLLQQIDFELNYLYHFINDNLTNDEILVVLHADHGGFGGQFPLSKEHTNIPLMIRGKGVESLGTLSEVVSGMDLYAIYGKLCGFNYEKKDAVLPKAFGGNGRKYAITHWRYPNQRYKIAINDEKYEFLLESKDFVTSEGKICENEYWMCLMDKYNKTMVYDSEICDYFIAIAQEEMKYFLDREL